MNKSSLNTPGGEMAMDVAAIDDALTGASRKVARLRRCIIT